MAKGVSIHIGLNSVDPLQYDNWSGLLAGCENDARDMQNIARTCGYMRQVLLLTAQATSQAVCEAIGQAARDLQSGDQLLLTYSGHGGQVPDTNGDEDDGQDETWVLYDRMLVDDELYALWSQFVAGVRIFVLSDSCHSGTVVRDLLRSRDTANASSSKLRFYDGLSRGQMLSSIDLATYTGFRPGLGSRGVPLSEPRFKYIPPDKQAIAWQSRENLYSTLQWLSGRPKDRPIDASIILISGCQDNQLAQDGDQNGLFTEILLQTWHAGSFVGGHRAFYDAIRSSMPPTQTPNFDTVGVANDSFENATPFVIDGINAEDSSAATSTGSTVHVGPATGVTSTIRVSGTININAGGN
jgi:hypothetical protein